MALIGTAKALYNQDDYKGAIKYSKLSFDADEYDRAFEANRQETLRNNFTLYVIIILIIIVILVIIKILKKKGKIPQKLIATGVGKIAEGGKKIISNIVASTKKGGKK